VDKKWNISQDIEYDKNVEAALFHKDRNQWLVETSCGEQIYCRWFILSIGFAARRYTPNFEGFDKFKGEIYHSAIWPQHDVRMKGKKVAQIGTGATGIQIAQTIGPVVDHLTVFQRTPNYTLPMNQKSLDNNEEQQKKKDGKYEETFKKLRTTFSGFPYTFQEKSTFDE
jgi:cation diffusion facilitator CzcD-associated flavoprotein CzcO